MDMQASISMGSQSAHHIATCGLSSAYWQQTAIGLFVCLRCLLQYTQCHCSVETRTDGL